MSITQCDHGPLALSHHHSAAVAQEEVSTQWGYSIDAEVSSRGLRIAVEADGPLHFFGRVPTGATVMKRRQVRHLGWRVMTVPHWEWAELGRAGAAGRESRESDFISRQLIGLWTAEISAEALRGSGGSGDCTGRGAYGQGDLTAQTTRPDRRPKYTYNK